MAPTIVHGESMEAYLSSPYLNTGKLKDFAVGGPRLFYTKHIQRRTAEKPSSAAQIFGQAYESLLCEPGVFESRYAIKPTGKTKDGKKFTFATTEGKEWKAEQEAKGLIIVEQSEVESVFAMRESLYENDAAAAVLRAAKQQVTVRCDYPGTPGLQSRPDFFLPQGLPFTDFHPATVDLKTCDSLAKILNGKSVKDFKYHCQGALARETLLANGIDTRSYLLACEKRPPYRCALVWMTPAWLDIGWQWCTRQADRIAAHYAAKDWPRLASEVYTLPEPDRWTSSVYGEIEEDEEDAA